MTSNNLYLTITSYGGAKAISRPTRLLTAASLFPFITKDGFSLAVNGLQPFKVWEHGQVWRLLTSLFLHNTENHLLANLSLGLLANGLYGESF